MKFDDQVFKANDIRGVYPDAINEEFGWLLGRGMATELDARNVLLGWDCRLSSPALAGAVHAGLVGGQADVDVAGLCPIELLYYLMGGREDHDLAVMVTASHNPPAFNGFKVVGPGGEPVTVADGLGHIKKWMERAKRPGFDGAPEPEKTVFAEPEYVDYILEHCHGAGDLSDLRVVIDPGNGTGGILWDELSETTGLQPVGLNVEPDGHFPAHLPNPAKSENLQPLIRRVREEDAEVGFAYDGDADRTVAVLSDGHVVDGSEMIAALIEHLFEDDPDALIAVSMTTSRRVLDVLRERGRDPVMAPVGHAKAKRIMRSRPDIDFAGEESGHYFYREFFCCESSLLTTLHLLHLAREGRLPSLRNRLAGPWVRPDPEPAYPFERREDALRACRHAARETLRTFPDAQEIMYERTWEIDRHGAPEDVENATGVRVDYDDWWFAVRPSGTEPLARLTGEARTESELEEKLGTIKQLFP